MAKYDIESFCADVETALQNNLNTKLAAIDSEKNDGITLDTVNSNAYHFMTLNEKNAALDPCILYGFDPDDGGEDAAAGSQALATYEVRVVLIKKDIGKGDIAKRMLRYRRALAETLKDRFDRIGGSKKVQVFSPKPDINNSHEDKFVQARLRVTLAE